MQLSAAPYEERLTAPRTWWLISFLLASDITEALIAADRVDPFELEALLTAVARSLRAAPVHVDA